MDMRRSNSLTTSPDTSMTVSTSGEYESTEAVTEGRRTEEYTSGVANLPTTLVQGCYNNAEKALGELLRESSAIVQWRREHDTYASYIDIPHLYQRDSWDCGLTCCAMILRYLDCKQSSLDDLYQQCATKSTWTIDLAYLLIQYNVPLLFCTITMGCNPAFSGQAYYKESFGEDSKRVKSLFERASNLKIPVLRISLNPSDLKLLLLSESTIAIALVNKVILLSERNPESWQNQTRPNFGAIPAEPFSANDHLLVGPTRSTMYTGHFVVVCGYNSVTGRYSIKDPARRDPKATEVDWRTFEASLSAFP